MKGIVTGAVASKYQMDRVNQICADLGIIQLSPLWGKDPQELLETEIKSGMEIIVVHAAANGLDKSWLGRRIDMKAAAELAKLE